MSSRTGLSARVIGAAALVAGASVLVAGSASAAPSSRHVAATSATNSCAALPASFGYSEFSTGNATESNGDSDGPTAFGGTSTLSSFAISNNTALEPSSDTTFVAGGPVNGNSTTADHFGNGYADATVTGVSFQKGTLNQVSQANLPVNFANTSSSDSALSGQMAGLSTTSGDIFSTSGTTLTLTATGSPSDNQYVWDLTTGQISTYTTLKIAGVPTGGTVVVNVPDAGSVTSKVATIYLDGTSSGGSSGAQALDDSTIFNFSAATSLSLTGTFGGTLFAPGAAVTFSSGHVYGTVMGATLTGSNESTYGPLDTALCLDLGPANALPQGRPVLLAGAGLAVMGGIVLIGRRRRRSAVPAI